MGLDDKINISLETFNKNMSDNFNKNQKEIFRILFTLFKSFE